MDQRAKGVVSQPVGKLVGDPPSQLELVLPASTKWGVQRNSLNGFEYSVPAPVLYSPHSGRNEPDDKALNGNSQGVGGCSVTNELYVYDLDTGQHDDYVVVLWQHGTVDPGMPLQTGSDTKGWFQYEVDTYVAALDPQGNSFPNGLTLLGSSPGTFASTPEVPQVAVTLDIPLTLLVNGTEPTVFQVGLYDVLTLAGWGIRMTVPPPLAAPSWVFHQTVGWDPTMDPPGTWNQWWKSVYGKNDAVIDLPSTSWNPLGIETLTAWRFDSSLTDPSGSLEVQFAGSITQQLGLFHNVAGCLGADGKREHHQFVDQQVWPWSYTVDLHALIGQT